MKVVQINAACGVGSIGKICMGISQVLSERNIENYILYSSKSNGQQLGIKCSNNNYVKWQALKSKIFGNYGFNSKKATQKIINELENISPDIVHLHNIHGHDCNLEMLFNYFREKNIKLLWTFHDCWAFTGYCTYFDMYRCNNWQVHCMKCVQKFEYSWFFDNSYKLFARKEQLFNNINFTIITPSQWLADLTKQSFLKAHPVYVIHNGIDLNVFYPRKSNFRDRLNFESKFIVLGVAFDWDKRKGLDVFVELAKRLSEQYQIVLVGTNDSIDKQLPNNIISIHRTQSQEELAEIYSVADLFVNPTREDNYPTVNMEAIACGTPVLTFQTGGSPEIIDETCGSVVPKDDVDALEREIVRICETKPYSKKACLKRAKQFDMHERFQEYIELYEEIVNDRTTED